MIGQLDYLVIGHVTRDRLSDGRYTLGGTATYAARTARALGCRVGVLTSAADDLNLSQAFEGISLSCVPSPVTTTFENRYTPSGRQQTIESVATRLSGSMLPPDWRRATIIHLGPVAQEVAPALADQLSPAFLGVTPQGWMRRWDEQGRVYPTAWENGKALLRRADAVVLSEEDVGGDERLLADWAMQAKVLVVTRGARGCTVYAGGVRTDLSAWSVVEVDSTGAGDIFAAVFFALLQRDRDPWEAARRANCVAALSVTRRGVDSTPSVEEATRCLARWKR